MPSLSLRIAVRGLFPFDPFLDTVSGGPLSLSALAGGPLTLTRSMGFDHGVLADPSAAGLLYSSRRADGLKLPPVLAGPSLP